MLCVSINQPWASLIVLGGKQYETRCWHTDHRGSLAIHASRRFPESARMRCSTEPFHAALLEGGFKRSADLPRGAILGIVELVACRPVREVLASLSPNAAELFCSESRRCRWAWEIARPVLLPRPIPFTGHLGLFEVPDELLAQWM